MLLCRSYYKQEYCIIIYNIIRKTVSSIYIRPLFYRQGRGRIVFCRVGDSKCWTQVIIWIIQIIRISLRDIIL